MCYKLVVHDSSPLAEKLYQRLGFINVAPLHLYSPIAAFMIGFAKSIMPFAYMLLGKNRVRAPVQ